LVSFRVITFLNEKNMGNCNRRLPCSRTEVVNPSEEAFTRDPSEIILVTEAELDAKISVLENIKAKRSVSVFKRELIFSV